MIGIIGYLHYTYHTKINTILIILVIIISSFIFYSLLLLTVPSGSLEKESFFGTISQFRYPLHLPRIHFILIKIQKLDPGSGKSGFKHIIQKQIPNKSQIYSKNEFH